MAEGLYATDLSASGQRCFYIFVAIARTLNDKEVWMEGMREKQCWERVRNLNSNFIAWRIHVGYDNVVDIHLC